MHYHNVKQFSDLTSTPFHNEMNAICWERELKGNFEEIVDALPFDGTIKEVNREELLTLSLSEEGQQAREILLNDLSLLEEYGASPVLNLIKSYERDDFFFPTDVYSYHVDRSPIPTSTFLCTYFGAASDILPNDQAEQKILVPEIRNRLKELHDGDKADFDDFLKEHFFDLHYQEKAGAQPINLGNGHLWRLAVDHPDSPSLPCVHRAPIEKDGNTRLLLIC
ncbi:MAG: DUF1826 domain-containing protein [Flavobacteriales bacterium]|nr:DUF1826 domain-containing protein [Flavobacteriales bacterium]